MLELQMTPATIVILVVIIGMVFLAFKRLVRKGLCDCKKCEGAKVGGCKGCSVVDNMLSDMKKATGSTS